MKKLLTLLLLAILTACSFTPKMSLPKLSLPDNSTSGIRITKQWWKRFNDKTLNRLVDEAIRNNEDLLIAYEKIKEAKVAYDITKANLMPVISTQLDISRTKYPKNTYPTGIYNSYTLTGEVSYEPDFFGKLTNATKAQLQVLLSRKAYARFVKISLISKLIATYFQLCATDREIANTRSILKTETELLKIAERLYKNGLTDKTEVEYQRKTLTIARNNLLELDKLRKVLNGELIFLTGGKANTIFTKSIVCNRAITPVPLPAFLPSKVVEERPDILESLYELKAENYNVGVAISKFFPNITITGEYGYESEKFHKLIVPNAKFWNLAFELIQPIFEFGRIKKGVKLAKIRKKEAITNYLKTVREAFLDIHNSLISVYSAKKTLTNTRQSLNSEQKIYNIQEKLYKNGLIDKKTLLSEKLNLLDAKNRVIQSKLNYLISEVKLYKSLGGQW